VGVVCGSDTWKVWGEKARLSTQLSVLGYPVITCPLSREHRMDGYGKACVVFVPYRKNVKTEGQGVEENLRLSQKKKKGKRKKE